MSLIFCNFKHIRNIDSYSKTGYSNSELSSPVSDSTSSKTLDLLEMAVKVSHRRFLK